MFYGAVGKDEGRDNASAFFGKTALVNAESGATTVIPLQLSQIVTACVPQEVFIRARSELKLYTDLSTGTCQPHPNPQPGHALPP